VRPENGLCELRLAPIAEGEITALHGDFPYAVLADFFAVLVKQQHLCTFSHISERHFIIRELYLRIDKIEEDGPWCLRRTKELYKQTVRRKVLSVESDIP